MSELALNNLILERTKDYESERARRMRIGVARVEQRVAVRLEFIDANAEADVCNHLGMKESKIVRKNDKPADRIARIQCQCEHVVCCCAHLVGVFGMDGLDECVRVFLSKVRRQHLDRVLDQNLNKHGRGYSEENEGGGGEDERGNEEMSKGRLRSAAGRNEDELHSDVSVN